jgi:predicted PurR-regulated permease PerM
MAGRGHAAQIAAPHRGPRDPTPGCGFYLYAMTDFSQSSTPERDSVLQPLTPQTSESSGTQDAAALEPSGAQTIETPASRAVGPRPEGAWFPAQGIGSQWDLATKRTVVVILLVATVAVIWISRQVIPLLVIAGIIAYILNPIVDLMERLRIPRAVSTLAVYLILVVGLILTPFLVAPILVAQLASLTFDVPTTATQLWAWLGEAITNLPSRIEVLGFELPIEGLTQQIDANLRDFTFIPTLAEILNYIQQLISTATNVMSSTAAIGFSVVGGIFNALIAVLVVFFLSLYLTKDAPKIRAYVESLFPQSYQSEWVDLLRRMGYIWQAFFRGQILLCVIIGVATGVALDLAGMPGALVLGILAALLEVIPNIGPIIAMIPAVIIALIQGSTVLGEYGVNNFGFALITVAIYFIIQQLEAYILVPRIIGGNVRLHPVVVVAGVAIGYNVAGIAGAFFAAPVIATCRVLGGYIHAKLLDYPPFINQPLRPRKPRRPFTYRRTVTGDELAARPQPLDAPVAAPFAPGAAAESDASADAHRDAEDQPAPEPASAPTTTAIAQRPSGATLAPHDTMSNDVAPNDVAPKDTIPDDALSDGSVSDDAVPTSPSTRPETLEDRPLESGAR